MKSPFYWKSNDDSNVYDAMNKGILQSQGAWIYFLGCDDKFYNNHVLESVFGKTKNGNFDLIIGKIIYNWKPNDSFFIRRRNGLVNASWSNMIWIKNTLHHQSLFYRKKLFLANHFSSKYNILADYDFNLKLYKKNIPVKIVNDIIAICGTKGISKKFEWKLYKEEIQLKTEASYTMLKPIFVLFCGIKYFFKKTF